jgi:TolB-like protein
VELNSITDDTEEYPMRRRLALAIVLVSWVVLFSGCMATEKESRRATGRTVQGETPQTLAILPFENNSITDSDHYAPLSKGLSAMLTTDLKKIGTSINLIERSKIETLLNEIALGQSGSIDQSTAVRVGRVLGAQSIAFGSFLVLGNQVRIDARIVNVETSEVIMAESITGEKDAFLDLERELAHQIGASLRASLTDKSVLGSQKGELEAALLFSKGIAALDKGRKDEARAYFLKCKQRDAAYHRQIHALGAL